MTVEAGLTLGLWLSAMTVTGSLAALLISAVRRLIS